MIERLERVYDAFLYTYNSTIHTWTSFTPYTHLHLHTCNIDTQGNILQFIQSLRYFSLTCLTDSSELRLRLSAGNARYNSHFQMKKKK